MDGSAQTDIILFLITGMLTLFLLAGGVVLFFVIYQRRILKQQLEIKEIEAAHQEKLLQSNIEQLESERKRIAKDLHDEIGSIFSSLKLKIKQIGQHSTDQDDELKNQSSEIIDAGIKSVRRISHDLLPPGLEIFGLSDTLEEYCNKINAPGVFEVNFYAGDESIQRLPVDQELDLFRIVQELTNNTIRHSNAFKIDISLSEINREIVLKYADNGKGFDPVLLEKGKGLGIRSIEARARRFNGQITWETAPNEGLKVAISAPIV
jgi:two-component system, NarL family, sensor kinase